MLREVTTHEIYEGTQGSGMVKSLRQSMEKSLEHYLSQLDQEDPVDLYQTVLREMEMSLLKRVLKYVRYNQCKAAIILGISRGTLRKKIKQYGLS